MCNRSAMDLKVFTVLLVSLSTLAEEINSAPIEHDSSCLNHRIHVNFATDDKNSHPAVCVCICNPCHCKLNDPTDEENPTNAEEFPPKKNYAIDFPNESINSTNSTTIKPSGNETFAVGNSSFETTTTTTTEPDDGLITSTISTSTTLGEILSPEIERKSAKSVNEPRPKNNRWSPVGIYPLIVPGSFFPHGHFNNMKPIRNFLKYMQHMKDTIFDGYCV